jgi:hypothetical protein
MKCPKCGYLGFETTDRCRNCQYDFSLAPFVAEPELTLHGADHKRESANDFELPPIARQSDTLSVTALDLDRLFGDPEPKPVAPPPAPAPPPIVRATEPAIDVAGFADEPAASAEVDIEGEILPAGPAPASSMRFAARADPEPLVPGDEGALR